MEIHPLELTGPWNEGWALDVHTTNSDCLGLDASGEPRFRNTYSEVGAALNELKYWQINYARKIFLANKIASTAASFICNRPWFTKINVIFPAPPSSQRLHQPVFLIGKSISDICNIEFCVDAFIKESSTQVKGASSYERDAALRSIRLTRDFERPQNVLLVDDIFNTGSTLSTCTNILRQNPLVESIYVLAITKRRKPTQ